ncbi:MAG TPA: hypothetical protein VLD19_13755, partial [Chitinophagaceae bacterium]|nr:hypothetical protein [Chitinophagaceae bacterium]
PYELEILNAGQGSATNLKVQVVTPSTGGIYYIPNSFQFRFPAGSGSYVSVPDAQVSMNGDTITFTLPASLLARLNSSESYRIKFGMSTSCGFVSGGSLLFNPNGLSYCGQPANGTSQQGQQLQIIGAPATYNAYTLKSKAGTFTRDCGATGDVTISYRFRIINQGPLSTSTSDGFAITLPSPWVFDTTSVSFPHNPAGASFLNVQGNTWYFSTGAGLTVGDSVQMNATIRVPAAQVPGLVSGSNTPIVENAVVRYVGFCSATGQPCPVSQVVLAAQSSTSIFYDSSHAYYTNPPALVVTNPPATCAPQTASLTAAAVTAGSTPGLSYSYYSDINGLNPLPSPATISAPGGTFYIKGTGTVTWCETSILPVTASFNLKPALSTSPDTILCKNGTATLTANSPGSTIQWTGLAAGNPVTVSPATTSSYQVIATSAAGCKDTATVNVQVVNL